jgi:KDO2-lipid IV(A) lauroyltransferase
LAEIVRVDQAAESALDRAIAEGPVVLFASHTGNWELAAAAAAALLRARQRRLVVVAKAIKDGRVDAFVARLRSTLGVTVLPPAGALANARRALEAGDVVAMPIDQVPERTAHATEVEFLGRPAFVDRAPAVLAWRARATILVVATERAPETQTHVVRVLRTIAPPRQARAAEWAVTASADATASLEAFVRRAPAAWFWLHRRWRRPLAA